MSIKIKNVDVVSLINQHYIKSNNKSSKTDSAIYVFDSYKNKIRYWGNMIDNCGQPLPKKTSIPCRWCRSKFDTVPIGCPIKYVKNMKISTNIRDMNVLNEEKTSFFETEGVFCSFPCVKSYIRDKKSLIRYKNSYGLLTMMVRQITGSFAPIPFASSWEMIKEHGGHLSIQQFRKSFDKIEYIESVNTRMYSSCCLFYECK